MTHFLNLEIWGSTIGVMCSFNDSNTIQNVDAYYVDDFFPNLVTCNIDFNTFKIYGAASSVSLSVLSVNDFYYFGDLIRVFKFPIIANRPVILNVPAIWNQLSILHFCSGNNITVNGTFVATSFYALNIVYYGNVITTNFIQPNNGSLTIEIPYINDIDAFPAYSNVTIECLVTKNGLEVEPVLYNGTTSLPILFMISPSCFPPYHFPTSYLILIIVLGGGVLLLTFSILFIWIFTFRRHKYRELD